MGIFKGSKRQRQMWLWGLLSSLAAAVLVVFVLVGSRREDPSAPNADGSVAGLTSVLARTADEAMLRFGFEDVTTAMGLQFQHFSTDRQSLLPEDMGSGAAWGDYDGDGDPDLFLVNFWGSILSPIPADTQVGRCALFRNDGRDGFTDVSQAAGLDVAVYGMAAAWGDYDNDQDLDLYLTCYGANRLFRNEGNGTFVDVTTQAGVGDLRFGAGCAWGDYDGDGWIDLYVCNYVDFKFQESDRQQRVRMAGGEYPYTLNPSSYPAQANLLYHNRGDGTFIDRAAALGVANETGRSLGVVWFDLDGDGLMDLYVANDVSSNAVFHNRGDGGFEDISARSLAADYRGAMGMAVGDADNDGDFDLFVTHWVAQENAFFENMVSENFLNDDGSLKIFFMDNADMLGLGQVSLKMVGWSTSFADFDNDTLPDLWVVNGHTFEHGSQPALLIPQPVHLFRQEKGKGFFEIAAQVCEALQRPLVGRGGAQADFDGDGKMDLLFTAHGGAPLLLRNNTADAGNWIAVHLSQEGVNTQALGAVVRVRSGETWQTAQIGGWAPYLSQNQTVLHFGLGAAALADELVIRWPDGRVETKTALAAGRKYRFSYKPQPQ